MSAESAVETLPRYCSAVELRNRFRVVCPDPANTTIFYITGFNAQGYTDALSAVYNVMNIILAEHKPNVLLLFGGDGCRADCPTVGNVVKAVAGLLRDTAVKQVSVVAIQTESYAVKTRDDPANNWIDIVAHFPTVKDIRNKTVHAGITGDLVPVGTTYWVSLLTETVHLVAAGGGLISAAEVFYWETSKRPYHIVRSRSAKPLTLEQCEEGKYFFTNNGVPVAPDAELYDMFNSYGVAYAAAAGLEKLATQGKH